MIQIPRLQHRARTNLQSQTRTLERIGIFSSARGVGDKLQISSLPENFFRHFGKKLIDTQKLWFFDHNPFIDRDTAFEREFDLWNFGPKKWDWPNPRTIGAPHCYLSNAELWASFFGAKVTMNRPRLYQFEDFPFHERKIIVLHVDGHSHGRMPQHVISHIIKKYGRDNIVTVGLKGQVDGLYHVETQTLWNLAEVISTAKMFIGMDSGPSWIAACYRDVVLKKIRIHPSPEQLEQFVPLDIHNIHAHWDDRLATIYNVTELDIGFTQSYRAI